MICLQCNKEFIKSHNRQIYCSIQCSKIQRKEYNKKYGELEKTKAKKLEYNSSDRAKELAKKRNRSEKTKEIKRKWARSVEGQKYSKEYKKKYQQTAEYKQRRREFDKKYNQTERRKEYKKNYDKEYVKSGKMKLSRQKYNKSEKGRATTNKYMLTKYHSDSTFKLVMNIRNRLSHYLKIKNIKKEHRTFKMIGCTPEYLKTYLEKKFYSNPETGEKMTWKNHTIHGWHIDHIIPLDKAESSKDLEKLAHYTNLQPLWSMENWKKKNKY